VSFEGPDPTMVRVKATHSGTVRFSNCAFWGPSNRNAHIDGHGAVGFSDCTFMQWAHHDTAVPSIEAVGGSVLIRGCEFLEDKQQVRLGPNVERAIVSENLMNGEIRIGDEAGRRSIVDDNLGMPGKRWRKRNLEAAHGFRLHHLAPESGG